MARSIHTFFHRTSNRRLPKPNTARAEARLAANALSSTSGAGPPQQRGAPPQSIQQAPQQNQLPQQQPQVQHNSQQPNAQSQQSSGLNINAATATAQQRIQQHP